MDSNEDLKNERKTLLNVLRKSCYSAAALTFAAFAVFDLFRYFEDYFLSVPEQEKIRDSIMSYGKYSILAFIFLQMVQVVVFFIPGEIVQIAGGCIYGTASGSLISLIGITIGSMACFFISHKFGKAFVKKILTGKRLKKIEDILRYKKIKYIVFILYLIPGIPKDAASYICGISEIRFRDFFIYSTLGRLPGIVGSAYFGAKIIEGDRLGLTVTAAAAAVIFIIGVLVEEKLMNKINPGKSVSKGLKIIEKNKE
jgi:uncharacterized membrane protein YdjX (TVP38/TMEM64 family)